MNVRVEELMGDGKWISAVNTRNDFRDKNIYLILKLALMTKNLDQMTCKKFLNWIKKVLRYFINILLVKIEKLEEQ